MGTRLAELAHADTEKPDTRIDVDLGEQRLGGAANHMGLVGRLGDGGRAGDRREIPKPKLELNRSSRDARLVKASRDGVHHPDQLSAEHGSVGEVTGEGLFVSDRLGTGIDDDRPRISSVRQLMEVGTRR